MQTFDVPGVALAIVIGDLEHWQHDTFIARWRDRELRADAYVTFALNPDGSIDQAKMRAELKPVR